MIVETPFLFKSEQKPFPGWVIVFDLQPHDRADPREGVGQGAKKSAVAETVCVAVSIARSRPPVTS
jgi:hypothetical protein